MKSFIQGIKNLIKYFKIIWEDRDWDYSYIYVLLRFKITEVRKREEQIKFYVGYDFDVKYMKICESLLDKLIDQDYGWNEKEDRYDIYKEQKYLERCKKLLFKILAKYIDYWWD